MSVHYVGLLSKRPGLLACSSKSPQATAETWHATDCPQCKMSLMGMPVAPRAELGNVAHVADFDAVSITVQRPAVDPESEPDAERVSWDGFDHRWVPAGV